MKKKLITFLSLIGLFVSHAALAQSGGVTKGFLDFLPSKCIQNGDCGIEDIVFAFILLTKFLIGVLGAVALLYFIWGGIQWMTSYGSQQKIQHGKEIMVNTVIALVVAFLSFIMVQFFVNDFLLGGNTSDVQVTSGECSNKSKGTSCGQNEVCTGSGFIDDKDIYNNLCVSQCDLRDIEDETATWICFDKDFVSSAPDKFNGCTDSNELCVNTNTFNPDRPEAPLVEDEDVVCCVATSPGPNASFSCSEVDELLDCLDGEERFESYCEDLNLCNQNYHAEAGCCLGLDQSGEVVNCQYQVELTTCEWPDGSASSFHANTACPPDPLCL